MTTHWTWLWHVSAEAVEDRSIARPWHRLVLAARLLRWHQALRPFAPTRAQGSLARDLAARPEMLGAVAWPYLCAPWPPQQRLDMIAGHYSLVDQQAPSISGRALREAGSAGVLYHSVRQPGGLCACAFRPKALKPARATQHIALHWDGQRISHWYEKREPHALA